MLGRWNVNTSFQTHSELIVKCNIECRSDVYASHSETHSSSHRANHWKSFQLFSFRFEFRGKTSNEWCITIFSIRVAFAHRTFECDFCVAERSLHIVHSAMCFHPHLKRNSDCEFFVRWKTRFNEMQKWFFVCKLMRWMRWFATDQTPFYALRCTFSSTQKNRWRVLWFMWNTFQVFMSTGNDTM